MKTKVIAHIDMDAFFAAVEQRDNPSLKGQPVIIGADPKGGKGRGVVSTCSYEARKFGIHSAMPISIAYRRCPHGVFLPGNMRKYKNASNQIFDILYDFTPDMEPVSVDEAFLDITGSYHPPTPDMASADVHPFLDKADEPGEAPKRKFWSEDGSFKQDKNCYPKGGVGFHFYQTPYNMCRVIKERIAQETGLTASIGIAPNKMVAKIASDFSKPDGLLEILPGQIFEFLWPLPIGKLWGVGKQTQKTLNALGIQTVGQLAKHSQVMLRKKLGTHGQHLFDLAHGIDNREVTIDDVVKSVSHEHTFNEDIDDQEAIERILSFLSEKVSRRLRKYGLKGKTVTLKIRLSNFKTVTRAHTFCERVNFFDEIYKKTKELFDAYYRYPMKIRLLGVRIANFDDPYVQESLFPSQGSEKKEKIHKAIDVIKDKFGERAIQRAQHV